MKIRITHSPLHFPIADAEGMTIAVFCVYNHEQVVLCLNPNCAHQETIDNRGYINGYQIIVNKPHNIVLSSSQKTKEEVITQMGKYSIELLQLIPRADIYGYEIELEVIRLDN